MKRIAASIGIVLLILQGSAGPRALEAQDPASVIERARASGLSQSDILDRLRQSGLDRSEVQTRLQQAGLDPSLADRYFDALEGDGELPDQAPSPEFLEALNGMGVPVDTPADTLERARDAASADTIPTDSLADPDSMAAGTESLPIFGRSLFTNATSEFDPVAFGPVDPGYRIGPGDELTLILTGDVEQAYSLTVNREGYLIIPDIGQMSVNGLTLEELEDRLYTRLGQAYSGLTRGPEATTHFQISLGRLHANQVFVIGEVERPAAYQVSGVGTVFNALYQARGPNETGSMRRIEVRRAGGVAGTIDLYDYLLRGDTGDDIRLMQGDIVFVPVAGRQVSIDGAVRRPAIYELDEGDGLRDLIGYAAGFEADAVVERVQIDRILPPEERRPGVDRVLEDVEVSTLLEEDGPPIPLRDGDIVRIFSVGDERRNRVVLTGGVNRPGLYQWRPGMTLWDMIERANGLHERAYTARAHIYRLNEVDGSRRLIRTPLIADSAGDALRDVALSDRDSVVVLNRSELRNQALVTIDGFVKEPGSYPLAEGMTLEDLILAAGGFARGAYILEAEVARLPEPLVRTDTTAHVFRVPLSSLAEGAAPEEGAAADDPLAYSPDAADSAFVDPAAAVADWTPSADELALRHGDHIFIRKAPGYEEAHTVTVTGEVALPGTYALRTRGERLTSVIERAGGMTEEAYSTGARLVREGQLVGVSLDEALDDANGRDNVVLELGDSIHVPEMDPTVLVRGAVEFETRALFQDGEGLGYYVSQAGGYADAADKGKVSVLYPNGERDAVDRFLFFSSAPDIEPGSTIYVPSMPPAERDGIDWDRVLSRTLSIMTTTLTLILTIDRVDEALNE